jgi:hypothetical protein
VAVAGDPGGVEPEAAAVAAGGYPRVEVGKPVGAAGGGGRDGLAGIEAEEVDAGLPSTVT